MNHKAHKVGGVCSGLIVSTILFSKDIGLRELVSSTLIMSGAVVGSLCPDIDTPNSKVGSKMLLKPISILINKLFGHRTITHSVIVSLLMTTLLISSTSIFSGTLGFIYTNIIIGFCTGWFSHLLLDIITIKGIPIYYPIIKKKYSLFKFKPDKDDDLVSMIVILLTGTFMMLYL